MPVDDFGEIFGELIWLRMADPISLVASVLAIATAAAQIGKAISRLRAFGEVPKQAYALKNEITDLELVLRQISAALQQRTISSEAGEESLAPILTRTKAYLSDLAKALEKFADLCAGHGTSTAIDRSILRYKGKALLQGFQEKIRTVKESLNMMLGASNS
ncbi:uncharacterized protein J4E88_009354 [Alternaria novae-zelandiae]|uniref:uncharacterized protein n=1 Tax=Alternaria novae-zelandiae TaxID=430562 RepID=UPI0020C3C784|nr:uncharacterized protein J4E88_009354 [Alternaria novae-zelandiae]KAI4671320.1 hypothetical protein J4E88_009354 [Alternaria novae-zelandiae]